MIEWMYSEPPGADPQTISRLTGHIGQTGQGPLGAGQGNSTLKMRSIINFLALQFLPKLKILIERIARNIFVEPKNLEMILGFYNVNR